MPVIVPVWFFKQHILSISAVRNAYPGLQFRNEGGQQRTTARIHTAASSVSNFVTRPPPWIITPINRAFLSSLFLLDVRSNHPILDTGAEDTKSDVKSQSEQSFSAISGSTFYFVTKRTLNKHSNKHNLNQLGEQQRLARACGVVGGARRTPQKHP